MKGGMDEILRQAQQLQGKLQEAQQDVQKLEATGESGAGLVKVTLNGAYEARKVEIDTVALADDAEMLEDLVAAAINDAVKRVREESQSKMSDITGGMQLPPGFKMPF